MRIHTEPNGLTETLLEADAVAALFHVSKQTLRRWVAAGDFPSPLRVGRRAIRWRISDISTFIKKENANGTFARPTEERNAAALPR